MSTVRLATTTFFRPAFGGCPTFARRFKTTSDARKTLAPSSAGLERSRRFLTRDAAAGREETETGMKDEGEERLLGKEETEGNETTESNDGAKTRGQEQKQTSVMDDRFKGPLEVFKEPQFGTPEEKLDGSRHALDPRLSRVFLGYDSLDEEGWTIQYSKRDWKRMKQIYGDPPEEGPSYYTFHPRSTFYKLMRDPVNISPQSFDYYKEKKDVDVCKAFQTMDIDQMKGMGAELYCAHFVTGFGGAVKFHGFQNWFDFDSRKRLPKNFVPEFVCEAIDMTGTPLFYEGMEFFMHLRDLRYLNLSQCSALDDWAIARLYPLRSTLTHLDVSGCPRITERGVASLHRLKRLRRLVLKDMEHIKNLPLLSMHFSDLHPHTFIEGVEEDAEVDPDFGVPDEYFDPQRGIMEEYGGDISKMEYEKFWNLDGGGFDSDKFEAYQWRNRPFYDDKEDVVEDVKNGVGWCWRVLTVNPWGKPKAPPSRRV